MFTITTMTETKKTNTAARELGKLRWKGKSKKEISKHMKMMAKISHEKTDKKNQELSTDNVD